MSGLKRLAPALLLLSCALLFAPAEALADPIAITSGFFVASSPTAVEQRYRSFGFNFGGDNLHLSGGEGDGRGQSVRMVNCFPCSAGDTFSISHTAGLFVFNPAATTLQFNGQTFVGWAGGPLNFTTDAFVMPPVGDSMVTLTGHFTMTGSISFEARNFFDNTSTQFFVADVYGSGTVTVQLLETFGRYFISNIRYDFQPQTTPTPEPATLLLLGSGLAGLAARHCRRSRRRGLQ